MIYLFRQRGRGFSMQSPGKTSKCFDRSTDIRDILLWIPSIFHVIVLLYYRNLKKSYGGIILKLSAHFCDACQLRILSIFVINLRYILYLLQTNSNIKKLENNVDIE